MKNNFYITTPIYYVNAEPHLGHAYTTILADTLAGYHKMFEDSTYFLTGTDEHGQKVQQAAEILKVSPQEHCDEMSVRFKDLWSNLGVHFDQFIRTTEDKHKLVVKDVLNLIKSKGEIYLDEFEGWYCVHDERYFTEKDLHERNCPECGREVHKMTEKNYFFKMSKYQDWLIRYIEDNPEFIQPEYRKNEVLGFLRKPLKDLCISRPKSRLSWGIPLPFDEDYVTYVWFDALLNYYSAVKDQNLWPASVHIIGKDILTTHSVYWPIMLKAADLELPETIFAHGWWLMEDTKMSKSIGNVINPLEMADIYGVDAFRYFLMREMSPGHDASFSEASLIHRTNIDLANDLGNLLSRLTTLSIKFFDGKIPENRANDTEWSELAVKCVKDVKSMLGKFRVDEIVRIAMTPVGRANQYLEEKAPWKLAKTDRSAAGQVLYNAFEGLRLAAVLLKPVMFDKCSELLKRIDAVDSGLSWGELKSGSIIERGKALFPRIEIPAAKKDGEKSEGSEIVEANLVSIKDFAKIQLRVAEILTAEPVAGADKLLKLKIDIGNEQRQLVAGIAKHYDFRELPGKKIIVIINLEKAVIRGVESQGMLLAASKGKKMKLLTIDGDIPVGAKIS